MNALESSLKKETEKKEESELEKLRNELGEKGGAGHFWGNDKMIGTGGVRNWMGEKELKKVLQLLSLGEKRINLKEREFRAFLNEKKTERNSKKVLAVSQLGGRRGWMDDPVQVC